VPLANLQTKVRWLMIVAGLCFCLPICCQVGCETFLRQGTIYSKNYDETKFGSLREGMTARQVEAIMGQPLWKSPLPHTEGHEDEEQWAYSTQSEPTAYYLRRWLVFEADRVTRNISEDYYD
jgi:outer membrane protein assembly factor BamE (lipoprotein component of BamABCDE complex)